MTASDSTLFVFIVRFTAFFCTSSDWHPLHPFALSGVRARTFAHFHTLATRPASQHARTYTLSHLLSPPFMWVTEPLRRQTADSGDDFIEGRCRMSVDFTCCCSWRLHERDGHRESHCAKTWSVSSFSLSSKTEASSCAGHASQVCATRFRCRRDESSAWRRGGRGRHRCLGIQHRRAQSTALFPHCASERSRLFPGDCAAETHQTSSLGIPSSWSSRGRATALALSVQGPHIASPTS